MEKETLTPKTNASSIFFALASIALIILGLIYFSNIIKPFVIAFLVWFIINQLKIVLGKISIKGKVIPSGFRSVIAFLLVFLVSYIITELLLINLQGIMASMPEYLNNLNKYIEQISELLNDPAYAEPLQKWVNGIDFAGFASSLINSFSGIVVNFAIVLVYVIFFLLEDASRKLKLESLFRDSELKFNKFKNSTKDMSHAISSYLWQKTAISMITAVISITILLFMHIEYAFLWAFLIFIFNFIPYVGPLISSLFPAIFAVLTTSDPMQFVFVFGAMEGVQIILGNFVEPKMMGKGTNIGPVFVIVALAFWGMIWGITGMILAVPVTAVLIIIFSRIPATRNVAIILSEKGEIMDMED